jgi:hypothetical protein
MFLELSYLVIITAVKQNVNIKIGALKKAAIYFRGSVCSHTPNVIKSSDLEIPELYTRPPKSPGGGLKRHLF